jgi:general secretion pathway protein J
MTGSRGFTLLELLIGMTLLGFMLALLFAGFRLASDSWDAVDRRTLRTTDEEMARALIRRLVTQLQPVRWKRTINQPLAFAGESGSFRAIAPLSGQAGLGGLRVIEFSRERDPSGGKESFRLVLRQAPLRYDAENFSDDLSKAQDHTILSGLTTVRFGYFGAPKAGEPAQWFDAWPNPEQLPQLLRVHLGSPEEGWSDLVVAPMIGGAGCHWNSFYKKCMSQ